MRVFDDAGREHGMIPPELVPFVAFVLRERVREDRVRNGFAPAPLLPRTIASLERIAERQRNGLTSGPEPLGTPAEDARRIMSPMNTTEASKALGCSERRIRHLAAAGTLLAVQSADGHWLIDGPSVRRRAAEQSEVRT